MITIIFIIFTSGGFGGPQIRVLVRDKIFVGKMNDKTKATRPSFEVVI